MKKLLCIFLIFIIMLPCTSFATDSAIECNYKILGRRVTVWGVVANSDSNTIATIMVQNKDDILYINQMHTKDEGTFEFVFNLPKDLPYGIYTLKVGSNTNADKYIGEIYYTKTVEREFIDCDLSVDIASYVPTVSGTITCYYGKQVNINVLNTTDNTVVYDKIITSADGTHNISFSLPNLLHSKEYSIVVECLKDGTSLFEIEAVIDSSILLISCIGSIKLADNVYVNAVVDTSGYELKQSTITKNISKEITLPNLAANMTCAVQFIGYEAEPENFGTIDIIEEGYTVYEKYRESLYVYIDVVDMPTISNKVFTIEYDADKTEVIDLCGFTRAKDLTIGEVMGTDVEILSFENGKIVFKVNKNLPTDKIISGTLNTIVFSDSSFDLKITCDNSTE